MDKGKGKLVKNYFTLLLDQIAIILCLFFFFLSLSFFSVSFFITIPLLLEIKTYPLRVRTKGFKVLEENIF